MREPWGGRVHTEAVRVFVLVADGARFGAEIDASGPNFGMEHLLDTITADAGRATLIGARTRISWPTRGELHRIPVIEPTPAYPHSLLWRAGERHPGLALFRDHLAYRPDARNWVPDWA